MIVLTENMSLDGVIDGAGGWFGPTGADDVDTADQEAVLREHMARQSALVLGRVTFEELRSYWPAQADDTTGIRDHLNAVPKYVVSRTMQDPRWEGSSVLEGDLVDAVRRLRDDADGDVGVTGSISVARQLVAAGVVDEYRLFVHPVVVGSGRRLFDGEAAVRAGLELVATTPFRSGIVLLTYRRPAL